MERPNEQILSMHFCGILDELYGAEIWKKDKNLTDTPRRMAQSLQEMTVALFTNIPNGFTTTFPCMSRDMVVVKNQEFSGLCPHHFMPVEYRCDIAYMPNGEALGLSKFHRIASYLAKKPMLQEELSSEIASHIFAAVYLPADLDELKNGAIVRLVGSHTCMRIRGTKSPNSEVSTTAIIGRAFEKPDLKQEFHEAIR